MCVSVCVSAVCVCSRAVPEQKKGLPSGDAEGFFLRGDRVKPPLSLSQSAAHFLPTPSCVCLLRISRQQESTCSLNITHITH